MLPSLNYNRFLLRLPGSLFSLYENSFLFICLLLKVIVIIKYETGIIQYKVPCIFYAKISILTSPASPCILGCRGHFKNCTKLAKITLIAVAVDFVVVPELKFPEKYFAVKVKGGFHGKHHP